MTVTDPVVPADAALAGFLQSIELAMVDAYDKVASFLGDDKKPIAVKFRTHHRDYADAFAKLASPTTKIPNQTLTFIVAVRLQAVADERGALNFAFELENELSATYAFTLTTMTSPDVVRLVATVLPVVSEHAATCASLAGQTTAAIFPHGPFEGTAVGDGTDLKLGFDPASFPVS